MLKVVFTAPLSAEDYLRLTNVATVSLLTVLACATVLAVLTSITTVLAAEHIANRHVRVLHDRLSNILAKAKRVVDNTPTTAED